MYCGRGWKMQKKGLCQKQNSFSSSSAIFCVSGMRMPKEKNFALSIIVLWIQNMSLIKNVADNVACCYAVTANEYLRLIS